MQIPFIGKVSQKATPWVIGAVVAGLVGLGGTAVLVARQMMPQQDVTQLTVPVESQTLTVQIRANGTIVPIQTVNLSPKSAGRIQRLFVEQGDQVAAGEVIAQMENTELNAQLSQARASLAQAQARLAQVRAGNRPEEILQAQSSIIQAEAQVTETQARLQLASERVTRNRTLAEQGAISRDRLDEVISEEARVQANLAQTQARVVELRQRLAQLQSGSRPEEVAQAEAQIAEAIARVEGVESQLEDTVIRAPFSGIITQKYATEGAFVTPTTSASTNTSATSTSIVALSDGLEVLAKVPEVDIGQIRVDQPVEIRADAFPNQTFKGRVRLIAPAAVEEQNVTSFQVRVALDNGQDDLRAGMNTDLIFLGNQINNALVVPTVAIVTQRGETGVLVSNADNKAQFRPIVIGPTIGNQTQVLSGLQPGDRIFVELPEDQRDLLQNSSSQQ